MLIVCSETRSRGGLDAAANLTGTLAMTLALLELLWLWRLWNGDAAPAGVAVWALQVAVQGLLVGLFALATSVWLLSSRIADNAGNGMPELELRDGVLRLFAWAGADAALCCELAGVREVALTPARDLSKRERKRRLLSASDARHMLLLRVRLERDGRAWVEGSAALRLLWWAATPWWLTRRIAGRLELQVLLCTSAARSAAVAAALGPLTRRLDLRQWLGAIGHVWQIEAGPNGDAMLVMAGGKHSERVAELLERPERAPLM